MLACWSTHLGNLVVDTAGGVTEQRGVRILQHGTLCEAIGLTITARELGHKAHVRISTDAAAARGLPLRRGSGAIKRMEIKVLMAEAEEKNQVLRIEKIRGTVNPADLMMRHLDEKWLMMLWCLLKIKHIGGRPSSGP